ncbi:flagellar biosynthetic protein FliR [Teichococcus aestuarii]|uniref:flagellar biosynthetic protein FliR n=1 Tax=Teichococcus aestuarii TaxID=568898 RepID=UPI0036062044
MSEAEWLGQLPLLAFQAALLMARIGACGMVLPGLGEADVPATLRLGLALAVVALLLPVLAPGLPPEPAGIGGRPRWWPPRWRWGCGWAGWHGWPASRWSRRGRPSASSSACPACWGRTLCRARRASPRGG